MHIFKIIKILLQNYEKVCVLIIFFQLYGSRLFEDALFRVGLYDPIPNVHIGRRTNPVLILLNKILKQPISNNSKSKNC